MYLPALLTSLLALSNFSIAAPVQSTKTDRITFSSSGTEIVGYHFYPTSQDKPAPVVIVAHGLGGLQTSRIQPFAERFAQVGYHAITFDYRSWGQSAGTPRNIVDVAMQHDDYRAAIAAVKSLPGVDPARIVLWGTSLSGGHVLTLSGQIPGLAGIIAQCPHANGFATVGALPPASLPALTSAGLEDSARAAAGQSPLYIPLAARTGELGALSQAGAYEGYQFVQPNPPAPGGVLAARFALALPFYNPDQILTNNGTPTFIGTGNSDNVTPPGPARSLGSRIGAVQKQYDGGHFDVYYGAPQYENIVADQIAFLQQYVAL